MRRGVWRPASVKLAGQRAGFRRRFFRYNGPAAGRRWPSLAGKALGVVPRFGLRWSMEASGASQSRVCLVGARGGDAGRKGIFV